MDSRLYLEVNTRPSGSKERNWHAATNLSVTLGQDCDKACLHLESLAFSLEVYVLPRDGYGRTNLFVRQFLKKSPVTRCTYACCCVARDDTNEVPLS